MPAFLYRTAQTFVAVLVGITIGRFAFGAGGLASATEIIVESVKPATANAAVNRYGLTHEDYQQILRTVPGVRRVVPVRTMPHRAVRGERILNIELVGSTAELKALDELNIVSGRFLTKVDVENRNNIAVVGALVAQRLFAWENPVGKNIRIGDHYFLIVGQLEEAEKADSRGDEPPRVYIPLTTMRSRYGDTVIDRSAGSFAAVQSELSQIRLIPENEGDVLAIMEVLRTLLKKTHERQDYSIRRVDVSIK